MKYAGSGLTKSTKHRPRIHWRATANPAAAYQDASIAAATNAAPTATENWSRNANAPPPRTATQTTAIVHQKGWASLSMFDVYRNSLQFGLPKPTQQLRCPRRASSMFRPQRLDCRTFAALRLLMNWRLRPARVRQRSRGPPNCCPNERHSVATYHSPGWRCFAELSSAQRPPTVGQTPAKSSPAPPPRVLAA